MGVSVLCKVCKKTFDLNCDSLDRIKSQILDRHHIVSDLIDNIIFQCIDANPLYYYSLEFVRKEYRVEVFSFKNIGEFNKVVVSNHFNVDKGSIIFYKGPNNICLSIAKKIDLEKIIDCDEIQPVLDKVMTYAIMI